MRIQSLPFRTRDAVVFLLLLVANVGCGDSKSTCVAGMQIACACPGGGTGVQVCDRQGRYGACACGASSDGGGAGGTNPVGDGGGAIGGATGGGAGGRAGAADSGSDGSSATVDTAGPSSDVAASVEVAAAPDATAMPDGAPTPDAARIPDAAATPDVALPPDTAVAAPDLAPADAVPVVVDALPADAPVPAVDAPTPDAPVIADAPGSETMSADAAPVDMQEQPPGSTQCTDQQHNDQDDLLDSLDPECTGPYDNDEGTLGTGVVGDNLDSCSHDCYFDANSSPGDDGCQANFKCDPASPGSIATPPCPYDPAYLNCPSQQNANCRNRCLPIVPNGCDCFGCCAVTRSGNSFSVQLSSKCTYADLADPGKCPRCTIQSTCLNPCDTCELCLDRLELPAGCASVSCPPSAPPCGVDGRTPSACPLGTRCLTGCCVPAN